MLKNKKILITSLLTAFMLVFSFSSCFAGVVGLITDENAYDYLSVAQQYFEDNNLTMYDYIVTSEGFVYAFYTEDYTCYAFDDYVKTIRCNNSYIFEFSSLDNYNIITSSTSSNGQSYTNANAILFSSIDIKNADGTIFFQKTPLGMGVLAPMVARMETSQVMKEIVGILPLIIVVVVSLVGLRKALKMLSRLLHKA